MTHYVALARRPHGFVSDTNTPEMLPTISVIVGDEAPHDTGLVTAHGVTIYRVIEREPVGFCASRTAPGVFCRGWR